MGEKEGRKLRKRIKPPQNSDEFFEGVTPNSQERSHPDAGDVSDLEPEPTSTRPQRSRKKKVFYKGPIAKFNPHLPPAAFPTDHHPDFDGLYHNDHQSPDSFAASSLSDSSEGSVSPVMHSSPTSRPQMQRSHRVSTRPGGSENADRMSNRGMQPSIFAQNMQRMERLGRLGLYHRNMREMETSDEDERASSTVGMVGLCS